MFLQGADESLSLKEYLPVPILFRAWQESLGKTTQEVTVSAGGEAKADFELTKKSKKKRKRKKKK